MKPHRLLSLLLILWSFSVSAADELLEGGVNPGYHEPPAWFKVSFLDLGEDVAEASANGRRVLLYFYQDGCPYCAKLLRENFGLAEISAYTRERFDVIALNLWGDREVTWLDGSVHTEKDFAAQLKVMFTPTLIFLTEEGRPALRLNGYYPPERFMSALRYVAGHREGELSFHDHLAREAAAEPPATGLPVRPGFAGPPIDLGGRERPLLVLFEQPGCAACDELHRDAFGRPEVGELLERFERVRLDQRSDASLTTPDGRRLAVAEWARELGVQYTPSLIFFVGGREVFRAEAWLRPFHLGNVLAYVADGAYREQPSFQRFIEARADALRERGEAVELME